MEGRGGARGQTATIWFRKRKKLIILAVLALLLAVVAATMAVVGSLLRERLLADSRKMTGELAAVIEQSLSQLMIDRNPGRIQRSLEVISTGDSSVVRAVILDTSGRIAYSSKRDEIGNILDRGRDPSCTGCHGGPEIRVRDDARLVTVEGERQVLRQVLVIENGPACQGCHSPAARTNGKLIIDRSVQGTTALVGRIGATVAVAGAACVLVLGPFLFRILSKGLDRYIDEIAFKSQELTILYMIVERLSKTIELEELKAVIVDMTRELFSAQEVDLIVPRNGGYSGIRWAGSDMSAERRMPKDADPFGTIIDAWLRGEVLREEIIDEGRTVCMPIAKGEVRFALLFVRRSDRPFDDHDRELLRAMEGHIAVAFDNAVLYRMAISDELTGLYSKRHFRTVIEKRVKLCETYGERLSLLMLDIDDFKKVNDTYGHPAGDVVLRTVAQVTLHALREGDMAFRYGGEEFAVLLPSTDSAASLPVAERIRQAVAGSTCAAGEQEIGVTVSIGSAGIPVHARTVRDLVNAADAALYAAKRSGKNRVVIHETPPASVGPGDPPTAGGQRGEV